MEYTNGDIQYLSFTKAKQIIFETGQENFRFFCSDHQKSNNFLNNLLFKYKIVHNTLQKR